MKTLIVALLILALPTFAMAGPNQLSVEVRSAVIRATPQHWSGKVATLQYGDKVQELSRDGRGWIQVKDQSGVIGYLHQSSVTTRKVVLVGQEHTIGETTDPSVIVLAGKGFSKPIEEQYSSEHKELNYNGVDLMEARVVSDRALLSFMKSGELVVDGGAK